MTGWYLRHREAIRDFVTLFAVALAAYSVVAVVVQGNERRDQSCKVFERQQRSAVRQVLGTYAYLDRLAANPSLRARSDPGLIDAILRNLDSTYEDAVSSKAPSYCDEKGVGLPESGPKSVPALPEQRTYPELAGP